MLPQYYRIIAVNNTGQTLTFNNNGRVLVRMTAYHLDSTNGKVVYTNLGDDPLSFAAASSTADGGEDKSLEIDNTSNKYLGLLIQLDLVHDEGTLADGTYDLYLDGAQGSGELASDGSGYDSASLNQLLYVGSLKWHASGLDDEVMRSPMFDIGA